MTRGKKKRRTKRTFAPSWKESVVARVLRGRANKTETQRQIAAELDVPETLLCQWVRLLGKKVGNGAAAHDASTPSIELKGLRAWVNHAVRLEVDRILAEKKPVARKGRS